MASISEGGKEKHLISHYDEIEGSKDEPDYRDVGILHGCV